MTATSLQQKVQKILIKFLVISIAVLALFLWACSWTYSEGTRSGNLIKVSKKGVVFKTYEGELNLGGVRMTEGLEGNIWSFTILNEDLINSLKNFEGKRVKLYYKERYRTMPWLGDTNYIMTSVEEFKP